MLAAGLRTAFDTTMTALHDAPYKFHLTGSRCFGYETAVSDWDFFVQVPANDVEVDGLRTWLTSNGFKAEFDSAYREQRPLWSHGTWLSNFNDTLEVWAHTPANIHIQIVRDAASKLEIQKAMKEVPGMQQMLKKLPKEDRKAIWKMGRAIFDAGKKFPAR
jgi:hypothetical protein